MALVEDEEAWFEHTPELGPRLERPAYLEPVGHHDDGRVFQRGEQLLRRALFLLTVVLLLNLQSKQININEIIDVNHLIADNGIFGVLTKIHNN